MSRIYEIDWRDVQALRNNDKIVKEYKIEFLTRFKYKRYQKYKWEIELHKFMVFVQNDLRNKIQEEINLEITTNLKIVK